MRCSLMMTPENACRVSETRLCLIAAADDLLVPWQLSGLIAEEIGHARLVKLDHGGHRFPQTRVVGQLLHNDERILGPPQLRSTPSYSRSAASSSRIRRPHSLGYWLPRLPRITI